MYFDWLIVMVFILPVVQDIPPPVVAINFSAFSSEQSSVRIGPVVMMIRHLWVGLDHGLYGPPIGANFPPCSPIFVHLIDFVEVSSELGPLLPNPNLESFASLAGLLPH
jgi:hypothetical protein